MYMYYNSLYTDSDEVIAITQLVLVDMEPRLTTGLLMQCWPYVSQVKVVLAVCIISEQERGNILC